MIKNFEEFINEAAYHVPLDGIIDSTGKYLANINLLADEKDYVNYPRYEFVFSTAKEVKNFENTTFSRDLWLAIYDYDTLEVNHKNDFTLIDANMKKFGNVIVGKSLYIYAFNKSDVAELKQRCENAAKEYKFKSVNFIDE